MPNTDTRRVREDYWYTSAQVVDVGTAWANASRDRLFLYSDREIPNQTALTVATAPRLDSLPKKILLPLNQGRNHWTAIAVSITRAKDQSINISISFTDSLNTGNTQVGRLHANVRKELERIETVFRKKYHANRLNIALSVYPHSWRQPDGSSCGPYSLANAARCLDGRGQEVNPGRKAIRERQLDMMTQGTAISDCSTNNRVDEILLDWIIDHAGRRGLSVKTPREVEAICIYYAEKHGLDLFDVIRTFHNEYCSNSKNPWFRPNQVNARIRELIGEYGIRLPRVTSVSPPRPSRTPTIIAGYERDYSNLSLARLIPIFQSNENIQKERRLISQENLCKKIDEIRLILTNKIQDNVYVLQLMEKIVLAIQKGNQDEAEESVKEALTGQQQKADCEACLRLISDIVGARRYARDNNEKFIYLASAYKSLADATQRVEQKEFADLELPRQLLKAELALLQGAIERNSASAIRQVSFAIRDFCSLLLQYLTAGTWVADVTRIERLSQIFKDSEGNLDTEMLEREKKSIKTILTARESLATDRKEDESSRPVRGS